jgi:cytochrome c-type biogenesis protein CcmH
MLPYVLTALAGVVIGIVAARVWLMRDGDPAPKASAPLVAEGAVAVSPKGWSVSTVALIAAGAVALISVAVIAFRGDRPDEASVAPFDVASVSGGAGATTASLDSVDVMIDRLAKRLEAAPNDGEGFRMLGWSYVNTGKPDKAVVAYKRALQLLPQRADVHAGYGEAMTDIAGGTVTPEAKASFDRAVALDPKEPRARYFEALYRAQHGEKKGALDAWIALANDGPADAPWQADLHKRISAMATELGQDVSGRLKSAPAAVTAAATAPPLDASAVTAASSLPETDRKAMIDDMVEGLARKLAANPGDPDGWVRLLRSRMVLRQTDQAARDLVTARRALGKSPAQLAQVNIAAKDLNVPGS